MGHLISRLLQRFGVPREKISETLCSIRDQVQSEGWHHQPTKDKAALIGCVVIPNCNGGDIEMVATAIVRLDRGTVQTVYEATTKSRNSHPAGSKSRMSYRPNLQSRRNRELRSKRVRRQRARHELDQ